MRSVKILSCALLLTLCLLFTACSGKEEYQDSLSCRELTDLAQKKVAVAGGYTAYDENVLEYFFKGTDLPDDFSLIYSTTSADINEIGIFHAPNAAGNAKRLYRQLCARGAEQTEKRNRGALRQLRHLHHSHPGGRRRGPLASAEPPETHLRDFYKKIKIPPQTGYISPLHFPQKSI